MKKWVVLSCTPNSQYDFFLPIAVRLWRNRIGYEPVIVLVGSEKDWASGHAKVARDATQGRIELFESIPGIPDAAVAMALRQQVAALEFDPDDVLMIGDVDLFPVDRDFYHQYDPAKNPVGVYYAETYLDEYWPAYGISMPVRNWRQVMGTGQGDFRAAVERVFTDENVRALGMADKIGTWDTRFWTFDERYASFKIKTSRFANDVATFTSLIGTKRPERFKLPSQPYAQDYVDFHCSRPGWTMENWPDIRHMLAQMIPEDLRWIDQYVDKYRRSLHTNIQVQADNLQAVPLPWDSEAFGVKVGLLQLDGLAPRTLDVAEANRDLDVVFVKMPGWHEPQGAVAIDYTYEMESSGPVYPATCKVVELSTPKPAHVEISRSAFPDARFNRDPKLKRQVGAFYEKWLSGDGKLYALDALVDDAFVFVSVDPDGVGRISLVAVFDKSRGISYGGALVRGVMALRHRDLLSWRVRVSSRNFRAIRFYEKLGFRVKSVQTAYHVWTKTT